MELEKSFYSLNEEVDTRSSLRSNIRKWIDELPVNDPVKVDNAHSSDTVLTQVINAFTAGIKDLTNNSSLKSSFLPPGYTREYLPFRELIAFLG